MVTNACLELMFLILVREVWMMEGDYNGACVFIVVMVWIHSSLNSLSEKVLISFLN